MTLYLPPSKNDTSAQETSRAHACVCQGGAALPNCPVHAVWDQILNLKRLFPHRFGPEGPDLALPLFPRADGRPASKSGVTETIVRAAQFLGTPLVSEDGTSRASGHSLRPTGAQGLTRMGPHI